MLYKRHNIAFACLLTLTALGAGSDTPPSPSAFHDLDETCTQLISPDGRLILIHIDRSTAAAVDKVPVENAFGYVTILDRKTTTAVDLDPYDRAAAVAWSPDGKRLAFNNYAGSDTIECYIYEFKVENDRLTVHRTDVSQTAKSREEAKSLLRMSHQYVRGEKWLDDGSLLVRVTGYAPTDRKEPSSVEWTYRLEASQQLSLP